MLDSRGFETTQLAGEIVQGWKDSPPIARTCCCPRRPRSASPSYPRPIKIQKFIAVQLFGRPESLKIKFGIRNTTRMSIRYSVGEETDTLEPSASVAYGVCDMPQVAFERPGGASIRFTPRNGDRFVIRAGKGTGFEVEVAK